MIAVRSMWKTVGKTTNVMFSKHLLLTNTVCSGVFMAVGDVCAQKIHQKLRDKSDVDKSALSFNSTGKMAVYGLAIGPLHHFWYKVLDRWLPGTRTRTVIAKVLLDQALPSPCFIVLFFFMVGILERQTISSCWDELKEKFIPTYKADCTIWPAAQIVNFNYVSPNYRVLYVNFVLLVWDVVLGFMKHKEMKPTKMAEVERRPAVIYQPM